MPEPDYFLRYRVRCNVRNFITSGKSHVQVLSMFIRHPSQQRRMVWRHQKTVVRGKCTLPSAVLVMISCCLLVVPVTHGQKFIYADDIVSPFKANTSANWNAVSRQMWYGCHTSVDSGDLSQAPPKQSAVCSTCIIPAPPVNCQFIWMASAFSMCDCAIQPILR